jgi:hypothetical protein
MDSIFASGIRGGLLIPLNSAGRGKRAGGMRNGF